MTGVRRAIQANPCSPAGLDADPDWKEEGSERRASKPGYSAGRALLADFDDEVTGTGTSAGADTPAGAEAAGDDESLNAWGALGHGC